MCGRGETIDAFISDLRDMVKSCGYCDKCLPSMIKDRIVLGVSDSKVQTEPLKCRDLTLDNCIDICKASENALAQNRAVRPSEQVNKMSGYEKNGFKKEGYRPKPRQTSQTSETRMCKFCGESHKMKKRTVPSIWTNMHKMWPEKPETVLSPNKDIHISWSEINYE